MTYHRIIDDMGLDYNALMLLMDMLPEWRREQALKFRHEVGRRECAMSYRLLCDMLREHYGIIEQPRFEVGEHGKPVLRFATPEAADAGAHLHFNLSHCRHAVACVLSDDGEVGIDVECLGRYKPSLAEYCMSDGELAAITGAEDADREFTLLWTRKEALLKLTGEGITDDTKTCLTSGRMLGVRMLSGCEKEKGYAWSVAMKQTKMI